MNGSMSARAATSWRRHHYNWYRLLLSFVLAITTGSSSLFCEGLHHSFYLKGDSRHLIGPVGEPFGFLDGGVYHLQVFDFELQKSENSHSTFEAVEAGFLLKRYANEASFNQFMEILNSNSSTCAFQSFIDEPKQPSEMTAENGIYLPLNDRSKWRPSKDGAFIEYQFKVGEGGLYFLIYQLCSKHKNMVVDPTFRSTYELDFKFINYDRSGQMSYLTAGEMVLPMMLFYFFIAYFICLALWVINIHRIQEEREKGRGGGSSTNTTVFLIHHLMTVLLLLKTLTILFESIRYHYVRISGHAEMWSTVYYIFAFMKGSFLFTVILLIGTGWSVVKPFLNRHEKIIMFCVLILQVINNIAIIVLARETDGEKYFEGWNAVLHLVDIFCCCAVLIPIVWRVNSLEENVSERKEETVDEILASLENEEGGGDSSAKQRDVEKLKVFRSFYLLVVAYVYATRIMVYLFASVLDYQHLWVRDFTTEIITLAFYVVTGLQFRPTATNPYLAVKSDDVENDDTSGAEQIEMRKM